MTRETRIYSGKKSLQHMVLGKLDSHMEKNEIRTHSNTIHKEEFKIN